MSDSDSTPKTGVPQHDRHNPGARHAAGGSSGPPAIDEAAAAARANPDGPRAAEGAAPGRGRGR